MGSSYRDELDAALAQTDALRRQNDALQRENAALRGGAPASAAPTPQRTALLAGVMAAFVAMGAGAWLFTARSAAPPPMPATTVAPGAPDAAEVDRAFEAIRPALSECATGLHHAVTVRVTFDATGAVSNAEPVAPADLTDTGRCVARVVRGARVAPFTSAPFTVTRPFVL